MKTKLLLLVTILMFAAICFADTFNPLDPKMIVSGSGGSVPVTSPNFSISIVVGSNGVGTSLTYRNDLPNMASIRTLTVTPPPGAYITALGIPNTCGANSYFTICFAPQQNNGSWIFSGGPGIPTGFEFSITVFGFVPGNYTGDNAFGAVASPTSIPEPATIALLIPGLLGIYRLRRS